MQVPIILTVTVTSTLGYALARFFSGKKAGHKGKISMIIRLRRNWVFHFHHWLAAAILINILIFLEYHNQVIVGFLGGVMFQGITYRDFYRIIYQRLSSEQASD